MPDKKTPMDHQPSQEEKAEQLYTFTYQGTTYTFEKPFSVVQTPRWLRANRRRDELDLAFTILEEVAGEDVLEVVDDMSQAELEKFMKGIQKEYQAGFR